MGRGGRTDVSGPKVPSLRLLTGRSKPPHLTGWASSYPPPSSLVPTRSRPLLPAGLVRGQPLPSHRCSTVQRTEGSAPPPPDRCGTSSSDPFPPLGPLLPCPRGEGLGLEGGGEYSVPSLSGVQSPLHFPISDSNKEGKGGPYLDCTSSPLFSRKR